jgi:hypothetical protein
LGFYPRIKPISNRRREKNRLYAVVKNVAFLVMPRCCKCGTKSNLSPDHLESREGVNLNRLPLLIAPTNLQVLCIHPCHREKTAGFFDARTDEQKEKMARFEGEIVARLPQIPKTSALRHSKFDLGIAVLEVGYRWLERLKDERTRQEGA